MNKADTPRLVEPILPVKLGRGNVHFAQGVKAGRWVFASGLMGQDFVHGVAPDVVNELAPHAGRPKREKEADLIFRNLDAVLGAAGTDRSNLVRTDQFYTTVKAVPSYQAVRREHLGQSIPPSTSIGQQRLLLPGADMDVQAIAVIRDEKFEPQHLKHEQLRGRPTSGYSPALTVGDFLFIPGVTALAAGDEPSRNGMAGASLMGEGVQWGGQPIKIETEFVITERIVPSLELAGASLADIVKAQVYLTDPADYSAFNATWVSHFGATGPALSVIPCIKRGLAPIDGNIEINVVAIKPDGDSKKQQIEADVEMALHNQTQAVKAGDLLFLSALMANDAQGLVRNAETDRHQPWFSSSPEAQAEFIVENAEKLCRAAGTTLDNVVRIQMFHTDISEFFPVYKVWEHRLGGRPVPFSAVEVPTPLPVPAASVLMDIWVYAP